MVKVTQVFLQWKCCSAETEILKLKYGNEKSSHLLVFSTLLTCDCVAMLRPCGLKGYYITVMWELDLRLQDCSQHRYHKLCMLQLTQKQDKWWVGQPCGLYAPGFSWQWYRCCHSSSPMAQLTSYKTTPEIVTVVSEWDNDKNALTMSC